MPTPDNPLLWGLSEGLTENANLRTQHAKIFENPDGVNRTALLSSNLHYQASPGEWEPQNLDFLVSGANQDSDRHWFRTRVSDVGIEIQDKQTEVGLRWLLPSRPSVAGNLASFTADGVDWRYRVGPRRLKFEGTVAAPLGAKTYTFPYEPLNAASDFTIVNGAAVSSGTFIASPFITGANGENYLTAGWILLPGSRMSFSFDDTSLPPEAYPYVIDPTTTLQPGSAGFDTLGSNLNADQNYSTWTEFPIGDSTSGAYERLHCWIKFDLTSIGAVATVSAATLSLFNHSSSRSSHSYTPTSWNCLFQRVNRDWVESEVTYNSWKSGSTWTTGGGLHETNDIQAATSAVVTGLNGTASVAFVDFAAAQLITDVQGFIDGGVNNYGWHFYNTILETSPSQTPVYITWFRSSDWSTAAQRPKLAVEYSGWTAFIPKAIMF